MFPFFQERKSVKKLDDELLLSVLGGVMILGDSSSCFWGMTVNSDCFLFGSRVEFVFFVERASVLSIIYLLSSESKLLHRISSLSYFDNSYALLLSSGCTREISTEVNFSFFKVLLVSVVLLWIIISSTNAIFASLSSE